MYVPSTINVDEVLNESAAELVVKEAATFLARRFGGATVTSANGAWVSASDTLVVEAITLVYAYAFELSTNDLATLKAFVVGLKGRLAQEAIAVEIDGGLYFI